MQTHTRVGIFVFTCTRCTDALQIFPLHCKLQKSAVPTASVIAMKLSTRDSNGVTSRCFHRPEVGFSHQRPCPERRCRHGGECVRHEGGGAACRCVGSYTGPYCDEQVNMCSRRPCLNGGVCVFLREGYK